MPLPDPDTLGSEFIIVIRDWLIDDGDTLARIDQRNRDETDPRICHTHDFCDSNQAMIDAFARLGVEYDTQSDAHHALGQQAWALAKKRGFSS